MKKGLVLALFCSSFLLAGCGGTNNNGPKTTTTEEYLEKAFKGTVASFDGGINFSDETAEYLLMSTRPSQKNFYVMNLTEVVGLENDERVSKYIGLEWEVSDPTLFEKLTLSSRPNSVLYAPKYDEIKEDKMVNLKGTAYLEDKTKTVTYKLHIKANS